MDEKKWNIQIGCSIVGSVALLIYLILVVVGSNTVLLASRILFAGIAAIASTIKLIAEISNDDSYGMSVFVIAICLIDIVVSAMQL